MSDPETDVAGAGRLRGKVAVVTGAAPVSAGLGIGKAIALLFARHGARVVLVNRSEARAAELQRQIAAEGGECVSCPADVTQKTDAAKITETAVDRYGRLDIVCNCAGTGGPGTAADLDEEVWDNAMNVNLKGAMWCSRFAIPEMIRCGGGSIVNVSTVAALQGFHRGNTGFAAYSASKAGLIGLTRATAADYAAEGVRANCLIVGMVHTPRLEKFGEESRERRRMAIPLRTEGNGWDVAWGALYLASDESRWVTGALLPIDGGQLAIREWPG